MFLAVTMAVALRTTPLFVVWLGERPWGAYQVLLGGYGYLSLLELGLGGALGPMLATALADGDAPAVRRAVAAGVRAYLPISMATAAVGLALTPVVPRFAAGLTPAEAADLRAAWVVGLAGFLSLGLLPLRSLLDAGQRGYVVNLLLTGQSLLVTGVGLWLARAGWGVTGQAAAQAGGAWAFGLALAALVLPAHPGLLRSVAATRTAPATRRALRALSLPNLALSLCGRLSLMTDNLVVGGLLDVGRINSFANTQRLAAIGGSVLQSVGGASWAALAELHRAGDLETFNRRLVELTRGVAVLAAAGFAPVLAYNRAFFGLWLGDGYGGDALTALAVVNALLLAEQSLWAWCFTATGRAGRVVAPAAAAAALNFGVSLLLTPRIGLTGPLIGSTVGFVAVGLWALPLRLRRDFGASPAALAGAVAWPSLFGAAAAVALRAWTMGHEPKTWASLVGQMAFSALTLLALGYALLLTPADRALWRARFAGLARSRRPEGGGP